MIRDFLAAIRLIHPWWACVRSVVLALSHLLLPGTASAQSLSVEPATIEAGAEATLAWTGGGGRAFITGIGLVNGEGTAPVHPLRSTTYWLVGERGGVTVSASTVLEVTGQRGLDYLVLPRMNMLSGGRRREANGVSFPVFLAAVDAALRDTWNAEPLWLHKPTESFYIIMTEPLDRREFVRPSDKNIGKRRVAFMVKANEPASHGGAITIAYELQSTVESRLRSESEFVPDKDPGIAKELIEKLDSAIRQSLNGRPR